MEAAPGFEPGIKVLQTSALPLGYAAAGKRKTGLEPATPTLARWCSTTELLPHRDHGWGSWIRTNASRSQSPLPYRLAIPQKNRRKGRLVGIEPTHARATIWCVNHFAIVAIHIYFMAGAVGIEPTPEVLETSVLPLNYAPSIKWRGTDSNRRTQRERIYSPPRLATSLPLRTMVPTAGLEPATY
jgi:hypothetical protein